jgi:type IV secretory pathway VirB3-like protein
VVLIAVLTIVTLSVLLAMIAVSLWAADRLERLMEDDR